MRRLAGQLNAQSEWRPRPARIGERPALGEVAGVGVHPDVEPVAAERRAVGAGVGGPRQLLPRAQRHRARGVADVVDGPAVQLPRHLVERRAGRIRVPPVERADRLRRRCRLPSRTARARRGRCGAMISWSGLASPGGSTAFHFHWIHRAELTNEPSFSAKFAAGSMNTSVAPARAWRRSSAWMSSRQNAAVSCSKFSATTSHFSFDERRHGLAGVRAVAHRVHAEREQPFHARRRTCGRRGRPSSSSRSRRPALCGSRGCRS